MTHSPAPFREAPQNCVMDAANNCLAKFYAPIENNVASFERQTANLQLFINAPELLEQLRALNHLAKTLNNRQHAGLKIKPSMWSTLYDESLRANALIEKVESKP